MTSLGISLFHRRSGSWPPHRLHELSIRTRFSTCWASAPVLNRLALNLTGGKKGLSELGKVDDVGTKLYGSVERAEIVAGTVRGSRYYEYTLKTPSGRRQTRLGVYQGRLYSLAVDLPSSASAALQDEANALISSFKAFPVNIICLSQSNGGSTPVSGSCY
jgi:hypothetical protein